MKDNAHTSTHEDTKRTNCGSYTKHKQTAVIVVRMRGYE